MRRLGASAHLLSQAGKYFGEIILHRDLLISQQFNGSLFDALNAPNALNATASRQSSGNIIERLHNSLSCLHRSRGCSLKSSQSLVAANTHHGAHIVARDFHKVSDEGAKVVTCPPFACPQLSLAQQESNCSKIASKYKDLHILEILEGLLLAQPLPNFLRHFLLHVPIGQRFSPHKVVTNQVATNRALTSYEVAYF